MDRFAEAREDMVLHQLERRGIRDERVLAAMRKVQRHLFVSERLQDHAYRDMPLTIGIYQTISQPYVVALMCEMLELNDSDKVLEIGTGSGYAAAVLSELCEKVISVERVPELAEKARRSLSGANCKNVVVHVSDGTLGQPEEAPFDAILVSAGAPSVPENLKDQLKIGGRLVIPSGKNKASQMLYRIRRISENEFATETHGAVAFVPLIGEKGWPD